ncbi:MAG: hypothetical protein JWM21_1214 [Acidobacteria bacterium]|nr:hypothetical protein [Acidobacteriota bacterium]
MKTKLLILVVFALSPVELLAQKQTPPAAKAVLFDFRNDRKIASPRIPMATQRMVLSKVFRRYLTDESKCGSRLESGNSADPLKAARNAGQIVPSIVDMASGSFTATGQLQTAYVISVSECNASHAENFGTKRVAIFAGQRLVADVDVDFRGSIIRKTDLNSDGMDELLMATGDMNQGTLTELAALLDFPNGRMRVIQDFGTVTEDSCASEIPGSSSKASVLSIANAAPGKMPKVRQDNYSANCRKAKRWRFVSTGQMQE